MKGLFLLLLLLLASQASANTIVEHVAVMGLRIAKAESLADHHEHGGMLYRLETPFGPLVEYLEPVGVGPKSTKASVRVVDKSQLPKGAVLVGTYHVHLCMKGYYHDVFSKSDLVGAIFSGVPEFMLDECTGLVHEFEYGVDKVHDTGFEAHINGPHGEEVRVHLPSGRIIDDIGETEVAVDLE